MFKEDPDPSLPGVEISGWITRRELQWLHDQAKNMKSVVDIGSMAGRSTVAIASACPGTVFAIGLWEGNAGMELLEEFKRNVAPYPNVHIINVSSGEAADTLPDVDMVFINGDHSNEGITTDLLKWYPKAQVLICGHDYGHFDFPWIKKKVDQSFHGEHNIVGSIWYVQLALYPSATPRDMSSRLAVLYITHDRPMRTKLTLAHFLESSGVDDLDVTIVANGADQETIDVAHSFTHPSIERVIVLPENTILSDVTNRFWSDHLSWGFLGKLDDDTIMPAGFFFHASKTLRANPSLGVVSALHWEARLLPSEDSYKHNILPDMGILRQRNVGGCCYLMPAERVRDQGFINNPGYFKGGWSEYQWFLNSRGHLCGYLYPFQFAKHLQDANLYHRILSSVLPPQYSDVDFDKEVMKQQAESGRMLAEIGIDEFIAQIVKAILPPMKTLQQD